MHTFITCSLSTKIAIVLCCLRNIFTTWYAIIRFPLLTTRVRQLKYRIITIKIKNLTANNNLIFISPDFLPQYQPLEITITRGTSKAFTISTKDTSAVHWLLWHSPLTKGGSTFSTEALASFQGVLVCIHKVWLSVFLFLGNTKKSGCLLKRSRSVFLVFYHLILYLLLL